MLSISMVDVLLILWDTKYFDGWDTVDTLRYFDPLYTACIAFTRYFRVSILLSISWYFDNRYWLYCMLKARKQKQNNHIPRIDVHLLMSLYPPSLVLLFSLSFSSILVILIPFVNWALSFRFLSSGTLIRVAGRMASRYWCPLFSLCHFLFAFDFYPFFYITSKLTELLCEWCHKWSVQMEYVKCTEGSRVKGPQSLQRGALLTEHGWVSMGLY